MTDLFRILFALKFCTPRIVIKPMKDELQQKAPHESQRQTQRGQGATHIIKR